MLTQRLEQKQPDAVSFLQSTDQRQLVAYFANRNDLGDPVEPLLFQDYLLDQPEVAAEFFWGFNVDVASVDRRYLTERANMLDRFASINGFEKLLLQMMVTDSPRCAQAVMWVASQLLEAFGPTQYAWCQLPTSNEGSQRRFPSLFEGLFALKRFSKTFDGAKEATALKSLLTKQEHLVVLYGQHDNDKINFRDVKVLPSANELRQPPDDAKLQLLKFAPTSPTLPVHLDRHFRLAREDALRPLRVAFEAAKKHAAAASGSSAPDKRFTKEELFSVPYFSCDAEMYLAEQGVSEERVRAREDPPQLIIRGRVKVPHRHSTATMGPRELQEWYERSRAFFADGTVAFLLLEGWAPEQMRSIVIRRTLNFHCRREVGPGSPLADPTHTHTLSFEVSLTGVFDVRAAALCDRGRRERCRILATRVQWWDTSTVLGALQATRKLPFEEVLLQAAPATPVAAAVVGGIAGAELSAAQAAAFDSALSSTVTLIQGPPGTGKTFLGTKLVAHITQSEPDPLVLIMAYTNHALDQLLIRIFSELCPDQHAILRLGSGTKEELVKQHMKMDLKPTLQLASYSRKNALRERLKALQSMSWGELMPELRPLATAELCQRWVQGATVPPSAQPTSPELATLFALTPSQRTDLWNSTRKVRNARVAELLALLEEENDELEKERQVSRARAVPSHVKVIGLTTTFAAKNTRLVAELLSRQPNTTVLLEEAAEILEARVLACLGGATQLLRLVMIGDHLQLPPRVNSYDFQTASNRGFDLNCSLFERLVRAKVPFHVLDEQRRMFHRLSKIVRALSYPGLKDATPASDEPIPGFACQLFFVDHQFPEAGEEDDASKTNTAEAKLVARAARHLVLQPGIDRRDITILTPYLGQVRVLREQLRALKIDAEVDDRDLEEMPSDSEDARQTDPTTTPAEPLRVSTVDNFQGEESPYVLVSMVRCNREGSIGWVKETQRVTVLLSRAKKGMIVFGSRETLTKAADSVWGKVLSPNLWDPRCVGLLPLQCHNPAHRARGPLRISSAGDFEKMAPNGGCDRPCHQPLPCGHVCMECCHPSPNHTAKCPQLMQRECPHGHLYEVPCFRSSESCPDCRQERELEQSHRTTMERLHAEHKIKMRKLELECKTVQAKLAEAEHTLAFQQEQATREVRLLELRRQHAVISAKKEEATSLQLAQEQLRYEAEARVKEVERLRAELEQEKRNATEAQQTLAARAKVALEQHVQRENELKTRLLEQHERAEKAAIQFPDRFAAPCGNEFVGYLQGDVSAALVNRVPQLCGIVDTCAQIAKDRVLAARAAGSAPSPLTFDEALAIALYTYELKSTTPNGSDNFYYALNVTLRARDPRKLGPLLPYLWHFKRALDKLPQEKQQLCYRGVPKPGVDKLDRYTVGSTVHWNGVTSVSLKRSVAEEFAGVGGAVFQIKVLSGRSVKRYSAIPSEDELLLEPGTALVVTALPKTGASGHVVVELLETNSKSKICF